VYKRQIYQIAESNRIETFLPELECSTLQSATFGRPSIPSGRSTPLLWARRRTGHIDRLLLQSAAATPHHRTQQQMRAVPRC